MNTRPPSNGVETSRSVWTAKDESLLTELTERKQRLQAEWHGRLNVAIELSGISSILATAETERVISALIAHADNICEALKPFCLYPDAPGRADR